MILHIIDCADVTVYLESENVTFCEGDSDDSEEVCVLLQNIPGGGTGCDIIITLNFTAGTACEFLGKNYGSPHTET